MLVAEIIVSVLNMPKGYFVGIPVLLKLMARQKDVHIAMEHLLNFSEINPQVSELDGGSRVRASSPQSSL